VPQLEFTEAERQVELPRRWCIEAADEIKRLRADLDKSAKLAYSTVRAERAAIVAFISRLWGLLIVWQ
jgi:hypothetical protein